MTALLLLMFNICERSKLSRNPTAAIVFLCIQTIRICKRGYGVLLGSNLSWMGSGNFQNFQQLKPECHSD